MTEYLRRGSSRPSPFVAMAMQSGVPRVYVNDHDRAAADAWKALKKANRHEDSSDFIFRYGDAPCRFQRNDEGKLVPAVLNKISCATV